MLKILKGIKNIFVHIRSSLKLIIMIIISAIIIVGIIFTFYRPTYSVTLNGEFVGYTNDKNGLQKKINEYMKGVQTQNIAFVDIETLPEYSLCFVKRDNVDDTDVILEKVKGLGTTYYEYYAITLKDEQKYYVPTKEEAEAAINTLKKKNSSNIDDIAYTQVYAKELKEYSEHDTIVAGLYKKKKVYVTGTGATGITTAKLDLGIELIKPISSGYTITSRFGQRNSGMHTGLDIAAPMGTNIYAVAAGTVTSSGALMNSDGSYTSYGEYIIITHGNGVQTLYGHCSKRYVSVGDYVEQGALIGTVGSTGWSTGSHLHLEIRVNGTRLNPQYYLY